MVEIELEPVDRLRVTIVMDNVAHPLLPDQDGVRRLGRAYCRESRVRRDRPNATPVPSRSQSHQPLPAVKTNGGRR
jgi:hypothetical protein